MVNLVDYHSVIIKLNMTEHHKHLPTITIPVYYELSGIALLQEYVIRLVDDTYIPYTNCKGYYTGGNTTADNGE